MFTELFRQTNLHNKILLLLEVLTFLLMKVCQSMQFSLIYFFSLTWALLIFAGVNSFFNIYFINNIKVDSKLAYKHNCQILALLFISSLVIIKIQLDAF